MQRYRVDDYSRDTTGLAMKYPGVTFDRVQRLVDRVPFYRVIPQEDADAISRMLERPIQQGQCFSADGDLLTEADILNGYDPIAKEISEISAIVDRVARKRVTFSGNLISLEYGTARAMVRDRVGAEAVGALEGIGYPPPGYHVEFVVTAKFVKQS